MTLTAALAMVTSMQVAAGAKALADPVPEYQTTDTKIKGTLSSGQAPALSPGTFTDSIRPGEKKYYGIDLDRERSVFVSAFGLPKPGTAVAGGDGLRVVLQNNTGDDCSGGTNVSFADDGAARPIGGYADRLIERDGACQDAGHYLFVVERTSAEASTDSSEWPVEIRYMAEPGIKGNNTPGALAPGSSQTPPPPGGSGKNIVGGTGFNDAAKVGTGVWNDRIRPGQTLFYRVPLDWGQQLFAMTELANAQHLKRDAPTTSSGLRVELFNPARGELVGDTSSYDGEQTAVDLGTARVDYANRFSDSGDEVRATSFSGWYYLAVSLHPAVDDVMTDNALDVTLRLKVQGTPAPAPSFANDPGRAGFGVSDAAFGQGGAAGSGKRLIAFAAFGLGAVLLLGLAIWSLAARRRPASFPDA